MPIAYLMQNLDPEYTKNSCNAIIRRQFKFKMSKDLMDMSPKMTDMSMANKHVERHSALLAIREVRVKTVMRSHHTPDKWL